MKVLEILYPKMYKIRSEIIHNFYDKFTREHARLYAESRPISTCEAMLIKLRMEDKIDSLYIKLIKVVIDIITEELQKRLDK